jgi:hypothetical protein
MVVGEIKTTRSLMAEKRCTTLMIITRPWLLCAGGRAFADGLEQRWECGLTMDDGFAVSVVVLYGGSRRERAEIL